ncbi:MAG: carboxymuconolactone decarboxylase family protein [Cyclobacteriaceae bacterium]
MDHLSIKQRFHKKIFTAGLFVTDIGFLLWNVPGIIGVFRDKRITRVFVEKIMTVTTAVNGCDYCSWFHAKQAIASGISEEEVKSMMNLQFRADANDFELLALLYAQHFAETNRKPEPEMSEKLIDHYGEKTAKQIALVIRMIFFGNLYGNTWDAVLSRFNGNPAKNSNIIFEFVYFLMSFWVMVPAMLLIKRDKRLLEL